MTYEESSLAMIVHVKLHKASLTKVEWSTLSERTNIADIKYSIDTKDLLGFFGCDNRTTETLEEEKT